MRGPGPWGSAHLPEEFACSVPSQLPLLPVTRSALGRGGGAVSGGLCRQEAPPPRLESVLAAQHKA